MYEKTILRSRGREGNRRFLDLILSTGFTLSLATMAMTLYFLPYPFFYETNIIMRGMLELGDHITVLMYGIAWAFIFTVYYHLRNTNYASYIAFSVFSVFALNFIHDLFTVIGGLH